MNRHSNTEEKEQYGQRGITKPDFKLYYIAIEINSIILAQKWT
jgi:hypothetical protein